MEKVCRARANMTMICCYCLDTFQDKDMCPYCASVGVEAVEEDENVI